MFAQQLTRATQAVVYGVADAFGFQLFNWAATEQAWVPATAGLASDQLVALLRDASLRRAATYGPQQEQQPGSWLPALLADYQAAICDVHTEFFAEYELWTRQLCLPDPEEQQQQQPVGQQPASRRRLSQQRLPEQQRVATKLLELGLWFCTYSEAANLRHTPHLLFLLFYIMRSSRLFSQLLEAMAAPSGGSSSGGGGQGLPPSHWLFWAQQQDASHFPAAAIAATGSQQQQQLVAGACDLTSLRRSLMQQLHDACPGAFLSAAAPSSSGDAERLAQQQELQAATQCILARLQASGSGAREFVPWVGSLLQGITGAAAAPGKPPCQAWLFQQRRFLHRVVQPIFFFLAEQIDLAGQQAQEEAALRVAYCDVNEACCSPAAVYGLLKALQQQQGQNSSSSAGARAGAAAQPAPDLWTALQQVVDPDPSSLQPQPPPPASFWKGLFGGSRKEPAEEVKGRYPRSPARLELLSKLDQLLPSSTAAAQPAPTVSMTPQPGLGHEASALHEAYAVAKRGADFWAQHLFKHKTFVEARSIAAPFVAFWRVYAFHAVLLTAMVAVAYVLHERDGASGFPWLRLAAALLLTTVTDALFRAARAAAHLVLLSARIPVRRKVGSAWKALNPFPPGTYAAVLGRSAALLLWSAWTGALAFCVVPVLVGLPFGFSAAAELWLHARPLWLAAPGLHALLIWGHALLCQRPGYTTSLTHALLARLSSGAPPGATGASAALARAAKAGAHAGCASGSVDALFYPATNLAVDKQRWALNGGLWLVVVAVKVVFEYSLVVYPLVRLMVQIVNGPTSYIGAALDLGNNSIAEAVSHATVLVGLAVPVILLSFSDTGLIFSLVGAAFSAVTGFQRGVGSIKSWSQMVSCFEVLLANYSEHCVSRSGLALRLQSREAFDLQEVSMCGLACGWNALVMDLRQRDLLSHRELACVTFEALQLTARQKENLRRLPHVARLGLTTVLPARCFVAGAAQELANGVIPSAHHLWVGRMCWGWFLWCAWQTGLLYSGNDIVGHTPEETAALVHEREREAIANLQHLGKLKLLWPARTRQQMQRWQGLLAEAVHLLKLLSSTGSCPANTAAVAAAVTSGAPQPGSSKATGLLHGVPQDDRERQAVWRDLSGSVSRLLTLLDKELQAVDKMLAGQGMQGGSTGGRRSSGGGSVRASSGGGAGPASSAAPDGDGFSFASLLGRGQGADITPGEFAQVRAALQGLRRRWDAVAAAAADEAAPRQSQRFSALTQQTRQDQEVTRMQVLQRIARVGLTSEGPAQVVRWLSDVLTMHAGDAVPFDGEAVRFITGFASSLNDRQLGSAPALHVMPSLTTLVPHYDEDVLYALSEADALQDLAIPAQAQAKLRLDGRGKMVYLLQPDGGSTPTLAYLRSVYNAPGAHQTQWTNFVERIRGLAAARGITKLPRLISEYHFLPGGLLHPLKGELLLWASWRGQLLARTVRGLATFRTALLALAEYENPQLLPPEQQQQLDELQEAQHQQVQQVQQVQRDEAQLRGMLAAEQQQLSALQQQQPRQQEQALQMQQLRQQAARHQQQLASLQRRQERMQQRFSAAQQRQLDSLQVAAAYSAALRDALLQDLVDSKVSLVVSSQNLGVFASQEESSVNLKAAWLVHSIHTLRGLHPSLKVAFIDKARLASASRPGARVDVFRQASVLLASERSRRLAAAAGLHATTEAYRVLLPVNFESARGVVLGEGKPENQNHAIAFCSGEAVQTIDCNQDGVVAEGLKLRNLLAKLLPEGWDAPHTKPRPTLTQTLRQTLGMQATPATAAAAGAGSSPKQPLSKPLVLVGMREWVFSEDSGALADFAAATETSFGTTVQRLMHFPGACRMHYGHPDVWRRSFVVTCGGVSKANKGLHVSEDVFGGYNVFLRGRDIMYVDFIAVGKGRDMGFETINTFEAKIAAGNGEQVLSREVRRLGHNMDFARLMTWYHTGCGFFINTALTMVSIHAALWAYLLLALDRSSDAAVQEYLSAVQVLQLGSLSVVVYIFTLALNVGALAAVMTVARQMLQGSLMFYIFRARTSAHAFTHDLLHGGAKYLPTGRGYKLAATSFKDLYRRFGRSHMYFGAVLLMYCVACVSAGHLQGAQLLALWAPALVVVSLLFGPFFFTPTAFRTTVVMEDFEGLSDWFSSPSPSPDKSWAAWNAESWAAVSNASGKQLGRLGACVREHLLKLPTLVLVLAAVARMKGRQQNTSLPKWATALILSGGTLLIVSIMLVARRVAARTALKSQVPRVLKLIAVVLLAGGLAVSGWATSGQAADQVSTYSNVFLVFFGTVLLLRLLSLVHFNPLLGHAAADVADAVYFVADSCITYAMNSVRFVLSLFDILSGLQSQLLFSTAYARQVAADHSYTHSQLPQLITEALARKRAAVRAQAQT